MKKAYLTCTALFLTVLLAACGSSEEDALLRQFKAIDWEELLPEDDIAVDTEATFESLEINDYRNDSQFSGIGSGGLPILPPSFSSNTVGEMNGKEVRIPGFIVPIEFDGDLVSEFFLVPSFGSCFHNPPPPPNQTIFVKSQKAVPFESIYDPVWALGVINVESKGNDIATAAYSLDLHSIRPYVY